MTAAARIALFALALAAVGGGAALAGGAIGPIGGDGGEHGHGGEEAAHAGGHDAPAATGGLASAEGGLRLVPAAVAQRAGRAAAYRFRVEGPGRVVRDFDVEHARRMHVVVVRRDLTGFQHLHPRMAADGTWSVPLALPSAGAWRVLADFRTGGTRRTLGTDLMAPGAFRPVPLPPPAAAARAGAYRVRLERVDGRTGSELTFRVTRAGRPVRDLQPYLGARGHLVALREGDLAYLHVHPLDGPSGGAAVRMRVEWPSAGRYRLFLQFRHAGRVHTAALTQAVAG